MSLVAVECVEVFRNGGESEAKCRGRKCMRDGLVGEAVEEERQERSGGAERKGGWEDEGIEQKSKEEKRENLSRSSNKSLYANI